MPLMTHVYKMQGLSCQSCVEKTQRALLKVKGILAAEVDFEKKRAVIEMTEHISLASLNEALRKEGDYRLTGSGDSEEKLSSPTLTDFLPLIAALCTIGLLTVLRQFVSGGWSTLSVMHDFMGFFFIVFGGFKLLDWKGFADAYSTYDLLAQKSRFYAYVYPLTELGLGFLYLFRWSPIFVSWITLVLMFFSSIGVGKALLSGRKIQCACLGTRFKIPMTKVTLIEDFLMAFMAAGMIFLYHA